MDAQPSRRRKTCCQETLGDLSQGTAWYLASWSLRHRHHCRRASAQHCTAMTNWPNTIQCFDPDDIMSFGIKFFVTNHQPPTTHLPSICHAATKCRQPSFFFGEKLRPVHPLSDKVLERLGTEQAESFSDFDSNGVLPY